MPDTAQDYWNTVESIATECREEYPDVDDDEFVVNNRRSDYIWESVDGSYWIIYYHANETVLDATNNEDAVEDVGIEPTTDWMKLRMQCAFFAMLRDVEDEVREQDERAEAEAEEAEA